MGICRIVAAAFLAEILLSLGFGERTAVRGSEPNSSSEVVSRHGGAARQEPPMSLVEMRQRLVDYEKAYSEEKCISSGVCGKATGKVCAVGMCCTREGYCSDLYSLSCDLDSEPQYLYNGDHCTDDKLDPKEQNQREKQKAFTAALRELRAADLALFNNTNCVVDDNCGRSAEKICAGPNCCTLMEICMPVEHPKCRPGEGARLKYSWPNCIDEPPEVKKYYEAKKKFKEAKAAYDKARGESG